MHLTATKRFARPRLLFYCDLMTINQHKKSTSIDFEIHLVCPTHRHNMQKRSIHQEAEENTSEGRFLQVPGTECERESSRGYSTPSGRSASSRSRIHFKTAVQMLAPVVWSRIYAKEEVGLEVAIRSNIIVLFRGC